MWLPNAIIREVNKVARIYYINAEETKRWNATRGDNELRMLTGWCWSSKTGAYVYRYGLKTISVAYRDAWYTLCSNEEMPRIDRPKMRVIK